MIYRTLVTLAVIVACSTEGIAAEPQTAEPALSGFAVEALAIAYDHFHMGRDIDAPLRLESYVAIIQQYGSVIAIALGRQSTDESHVAFVDMNTMLVLSNPSPSLPFEGKVVLPGVVAGEIILAYRHTLSDKQLPKAARASIMRSAYSLKVSVGSTSTWLLFFAASPSQTGLGQHGEQAAPTSGPKCIAGACHGELAYYRVFFSDGHVIIENRSIL